MATRLKTLPAATSALYMLAISGTALLMVGCGSTDGPQHVPGARYAPAGEHDAAQYVDDGSEVDDDSVDLQAYVSANPEVRAKVGNFVEVPADRLPNYRIRVVENNKFGYMDLNEKVVIPCQYVAAEPFSEGLACVKKKDKWGFIDHTGRYVLQPIYDKAKPFDKGQAEVTVGDQYGFIDAKGDWAYGPFKVSKFLTRGEGHDEDDDAPAPQPPPQR